MMGDMVSPGACRSFGRLVSDPTGSPTQRDVVRSCLEQIGLTVDIARRLVEAGRQVDLVGLDGQMGFVCAQALDLPPDDGRDLRPVLIELLGAVDTLAGALGARAPPAA